MCESRSDGNLESRAEEGWQEAGSKAGGRAHRFWDALTQLRWAIILRAMGKPHGFFIS